MEPKLTPIGCNDPFHFECSPDVPCFNECCRDLNQFLTPYDILRLKNHLGLSSEEFLGQYTSQHIGPESGLPIITFKVNHAQELKCPFVTPAGCSVYESRPSACRAYPLMRVVSRSRETGRINEQFLLLQEPHCLGFNQARIQTVGEWIESQGLSMYNQMNDMMMEIISLKNQLMPGQLDLKSSVAFHMACYDLDKFRSHIFENRVVEDCNLDNETLESLKSNDEALLRFGLGWIKETLFGVQP